MRPKKILVVDSDPSALVLVTGLVEKAGYGAIGFQKPGLAMAYFDSPESRDVRMIIADMVMQGTDGFSFLKEIKKKEHVRLMPFLFLSELNDTSVLINAYEHGAVDYFIKPIKKENVFVAKIRAMAEAYDKTLLSANTLLAGHLEEKPLIDIITVCERESLNGFLKITSSDGFTGVISFVKGMPEKEVIIDRDQKICFTDAEAFEKMNEWSKGEFIVRRGTPDGR